MRHTTRTEENLRQLAKQAIAAVDAHQGEPNKKIRADWLGSLAPPAGLELGFTSSLRLSYTNFASKILPCRASAQIVTLPQVQQEREKENRVRMDSVSFLGS